MSNCLSVYSSQSSKAFELAIAYVWIEEKILAPYSNVGYVVILQKKETRRIKTKMLHEFLLIVWIKW